jgi:hypothetical protein
LSWLLNIDFAKVQFLTFLSNFDKLPQRIFEQRQKSKFGILQIVENVKTFQTSQKSSQLVTSSPKNSDFYNGA